MLFIEDACGGETVDVRMVGEVIAECMYGEDDASAAIGNSGLLLQPLLKSI